ncbi:hypothetical protein V6X62_01580 [Spiribacter sp. 218]|uniref:hypothetical protein n=1 Tax=Spiribacter pallidus TaxID=1987936 RepID=UPI00349FB175
MEVSIKNETLTRYQRNHAERIFEACIGQVVREHQHFTEDALEAFILDTFVYDWIDVCYGEDCSTGEELTAKKKAYAAFEYANQTMGALGAVRILVDTLNVDPPSKDFMDRLERALDNKILCLQLKAVTLPAKEFAFTL